MSAKFLAVFLGVVLLATSTNAGLSDIIDQAKDTVSSGVDKIGDTFNDLLNKTGITGGGKGKNETLAAILAAFPAECKDYYAAIINNTDYQTCSTQLAASPAPTECPQVCVDLYKNAPKPTQTCVDTLKNMTTAAATTSNVTAAAEATGPCAELMAAGNGSEAPPSAAYAASVMFAGFVTLAAMLF